MKKIFLLFLSAFLLFICGCVAADDNNSENGSNSETRGDEEKTLTGNFTYNNNGEISFTDNEYAADMEDESFANKVTITFNGEAEPTVTGTNDNIVITKDKDRGNGKTYLIVKSTVKAEYEVSGTCNDGALLIFSEKKFKLILNNLTLQSNNWSAVNIQSKKRCFVVIDGENNLIGAGTMNPGENLKNPEYIEGVSDTKDENLDYKGAFFSEGQLIFKGNGILNVTGREKHALCSDEYVRVLSGKINVLGAPSDGIHTNDAVIVNGGEIAVNSSGDGIECEKGFIYVNAGKISVQSGKIGIKASKDSFTESSSLSERSFIFIEGGEVSVATSGNKGHGIAAESHLAITGGKVAVRTSGNSAKGLKSGANADSTAKGDIVIAKNAEVSVKVTGASSGAVVVKSDAGIYLRGGKLSASALGNEGKGLAADDKIVISGGENSVYAVGNVLEAAGAVFEKGADLLAAGSGATAEITAAQKYLTGGLSSSVKSGDTWEIADKSGTFLTDLNALNVLFTRKGLTEKPTVKIAGTDCSANFELK